LGSGIGISVMEIINLIEDISNQKVNYIYKERHPRDAAFLVANNNKVFKVLNWKPEKSIEEVIESAWKWQLS
tara:strand:- start:1577 stop:1792 length:216 start_codon:yes stop_codon:yes gene_type:complete